MERFAQETAQGKALHGHLLEHLDYEELQAGPALRRLQRIPGR